MKTIHFHLAIGLVIAAALLLGATMGLPHAKAPTPSATTAGSNNSRPAGTDTPQESALDAAVLHPRAHTKGANPSDSLAVRITDISPTEAIALGDVLVADAANMRPIIIAALQAPLPSQALGQLANILGRIGSDDGIQAVFTAAATQEDFAKREALMSGLTSGVSTPEAATLLATAALGTADPALLAPIIETVSRLADETVLRDLVNLSAEQEQVPGQRAVLAQMIAGIRNPDLATLLAGIGQTEHFSQSMRDAAGDAARALGSPTVEDAQLPAIDSSPAVPQ